MTTEPADATSTVLLKIASLGFRFTFHREDDDPAGHIRCIASHPTIIDPLRIHGPLRDVLQSVEAWAVSGGSSFPG